jgi:hypothetical protein
MKNQDKSIPVYITTQYPLSGIFKKKAPFLSDNCHKITFAGYQPGTLAYDSVVLYEKKTRER